MFRAPFDQELDRLEAFYLQGRAAAGAEADVPDGLEHRRTPELEHRRTPELADPALERLSKRRRHASEGADAPAKPLFFFETKPADTDCYFTQRDIDPALQDQLNFVRTFSMWLYEDSQGKFVSVEVLFRQGLRRAGETKPCFQLRIVHSAADDGAPEDTQDLDHWFSEADLNHATDYETLNHTAVHGWPIAACLHFTSEQA